MENMLLTELTRVRELMGLKNTEFKSSLIESMTGKQLLTEGDLLAIEKILMAGIKTSDELEKLFKSIEQLTGVKMNFTELEKKYPELKGKTEVEKMKKYSEILEKKISEIEAKLKGDFYDKSKLLKDFPELKPIETQIKTSNAKGVSFDVALAKNVREKLLPIFTDANQPYLSILDTVLIKWNKWLEYEFSTRTADQPKLTEAELHSSFTELLEKEIKNNKALESAQKNDPSKVPDFVKYAWDKYINEHFPAEKADFSENLVKPLEKGKTAGEYAPKEAGGKNTQVLPGEAPSRADIFLIKYFPSVRILFQGIINLFSKVSKEIMTAERRIQKNMKILENLDVSAVLEEGKVPRELQDIFTQITADLELSSKKRGEFILEYNKFIEKLKTTPGWNEANITKIEQETLQSGSWGRFINAGENLETYLVTYRKRFLNPDGTIKTWFETFEATLSEGSKVTKEFYEGSKGKVVEGGERLAVSNTLVKKIINGFKNIKLSRYLSFLTYKTFFTPRQILRMLRQGGTSVRSLLGSFLAADLVLNVWIRGFNVICIIFSYVYKFLFTDVVGGNEENETGWHQMTEDLVGATVPFFLSDDELKRQDLQNWLGGYVVPLDFNAPIPELIKDLYKYLTQPNKAEEWIYKTYYQRRAALWDELPDEQKKEKLEILSQGFFGAFNKFTTTFVKRNERTRDYKEMIKQNNISESGATEVFQKIYNSRIGTINLNIKDQPKEVQENIKSLWQKTYSKEEIDLGLKNSLDKIKEAITVGAFVDKNGIMYTIDTKTDSHMDYNFSFNQINFRPSYEVFYNKRDKYFQVYYSDRPDKLPIAQEKKDLLSAGIDISGFEIEDTGHISKGESYSVKTELDIRNKLSDVNEKKPEIQYGPLDLKNFYKKL